MAHPKKRIYRDGSPGAKRGKTGTTLARIKREIAAAPEGERSAIRRHYHGRGLLGRGTDAA